MPIHRNQYRKSALQFFPSSSHCLLVTEFNDDGSEGSEEEEAAEGGAALLTLREAEH